MRATFLGLVVWWIFSSESDVLYVVCGIYNKHVVGKAP